MIRDRRSSQRGRYWAVSLLAALAVALTAQPLAAAPRPGINPSAAAEQNAPTPTRIEGYIKSMNGTSWKVDQTPVVLGPQTTLIQKKGQAAVGAWVLVAGNQYPDRLDADTIEVQRPAGAPIPSYEFSGILQKPRSEVWTIGDAFIDITASTKIIGNVLVDGLVVAKVQRVDGNRLQALEIRAIAPNATSVPAAIEGTVEMVTDNSWVVDRRPVEVPAGQGVAAGQGDTVEIAALERADGSLVAQEARVVDTSHDTMLDGLVTAVNGIGEDNQTWTVQVFSNGRAERKTIRVEPGTYVDEDRAVIQANVEARVQGVTGDAGVAAATISLEQPAPGAAAGALSAAGPDELWQVGGQQVWLASDALRLEAQRIALAAPAGLAASPDGSSGQVVVRGVRLSSGVLIGQEVFTPEAAAAAGIDAASLDTGWYGPTGIDASLSSATKPTILFDAQGDGHAVYESLGKIYYAHQPQGRSWNPAVKIGTGIKPTATFDAQGQLHVAYANEFMGNYDILHVRLTPTGWTLPHVVAPTTGKSDDPVIAAGPDGKVYAAWMDFTSGEWAIQMGTWDGKNWTSYPVPNARGQSPALGLMPDGALFLAWQDRIPLGINLWGNYDIFASERVTATKSWSLPVNVSDNRAFRPGTDSLGARLATNGEMGGLAHIAWIDNKAQVRYAHGRGGYWPVPVDVTGKLALARGLSLQIARDGQLYMAWDEGVSLRITVSPTRTQSWPAAITVATRSAPASGSVADVCLATSGDGVAVSWVQKHHARQDGRV